MIDNVYYCIHYNFMRNFDEILPVTEAKKRLLELIKRLQEGSGSTLITKNGAPAGVLMSMEEYEGLLETLDIMSNPETVKALREAKKNVDAGLVYSHEEVWGEED